jgi:hypothetical protein
MNVADYINARLREFVARLPAAHIPPKAPDWSKVRPIRQPDGVYIWRAR